MTRAAVLCLGATVACVGCSERPPPDERPSKTYAPKMWETDSMIPMYGGASYLDDDPLPPPEGGS